MSIKTLERLFQGQADKKGPCPLPDPETKGVRAIEHTGLVRVEPQPAGWKYDEDDNKAENARFLEDIKKLGLSSEEIKKLLDKLSNN